MTSKIFACLLIVAAVSGQQDEDDGSYNAEKYEKPYEGLVDENPVQNQLPAAFQQPQPQQVQPQQPSFFRQQQQPPAPAQAPFPQNPFFRQLQNPEFQQQFSANQQQSLIPRTQAFQPQNVPAFQQRSPTFAPQPSAPSFRQPAPVAQFLDDGAPLTSTNYQTDDGHQRSEVVDNNGNVQGQYSYVDPNGKTITVKYSAGKDGFQVEGDHIPRVSQPQPEQPQLNALPQQPSSFVQPQPNVPRNFNNIPFRPQQARFNNGLPQQVFNPPQSQPQFNSFQPRSQFGPQQQPLQFNQESPLSFQEDGGYAFQSSFQ